MLAGLLAVAMLIMKLFPRTPTADALTLYLVELPIRTAQRLERKHLILVAILLCAGQSLALIGSAELALAYAVDMSIYYDLLIAAWTAAALGRLKEARLAFRMRRPRRLRARPLTRARAPKRSKTETTCGQPANDEDDIGLLKAA